MDVREGAETVDVAVELHEDEVPDLEPEVVIRAYHEVAGPNQHPMSMGTLRRAHHMARGR